MRVETNPRKGVSFYARSADAHGFARASCPVSMAPARDYGANPSAALVEIVEDNDGQRADEHDDQKGK